MMRTMSAKALGCAVVSNAQGQVLGIFTDGDLRRCIETGIDLRTAQAAQVMHSQPRSIAADALAADAAALMEQHGITSVLVTEPAPPGQAPLLRGLVHIRDLMRAKVI